jgi:hypothetical protein
MPEASAASPLFAAQHAGRYDRQAMIRAYEEKFGCRLVVISDFIYGYSIILLEELIHDADPNQDLHLMLNSPGGDGETAVRMARSAQERCRELTVIVPDQAKSAGTLLTLGSHHIMMGPTSDLGPVDPQLQLKPGNLVAAKDIIAAVDDAAARVSQNPNSYPLFASMMSDLNVIILQQAKSALARTEDLLREAISANPDRDEALITRLAAAVKAVLVDAPQTHGAGFGANAAEAAELPIIHSSSNREQWTMLWLLWARYASLQQRIYEGFRASQVLGSWP